MKNKRWVLVACLSLVCVASLTTYAFLQATTEIKTNVFASSKSLDSKLTEEAFDEEIAKDYMPGQLIAKDPVLHNLSTDEKGTVYAALKVSYLDHDDALIQKKAFEDTYAKITGVSGKWELIAKNDSGEEIYLYTEILAPNGGKSDALFTGITVNKDIASVYDTNYKLNEIYYKDKEGNRVACSDMQELNAYTSYTDKLGNAIQPLTLPGFKIQIQGYVSQAHLVEKDDAVNAIINLVNANSENNSFK